MYGPDRRERVEPVPDAAAPEQHFVVGLDAGNDALYRRRGGHRRIGLQAERHDVDQVSQIRIGVGDLGIDPAERAEHAEPEVALALARADEGAPGRERDLL